MTRSEILPGIYLTQISDSRYVCNRLSVNFFVPLQRESAARNALLSYLMRRSSAAYPDFASLGRRLYDMYGAYYDCLVSSLGESQILSFVTQTIDSAHAFEPEPLVEEMADFLLAMALHPKTGENGLFEDEIESERKNLLLDIQSEINNKRAYALRQVRNTLFAGTPSAISKLGEEADIPAITPADLKSAHEDLLRTARIEIIATGCNRFTGLEKLLQNKLSDIPRNLRDIVLPGLPPAQNFVRQTEHEELTQSKLAMAFFIDDLPLESDLAAMRTAVALFGASPTSRLFREVREKQSLCYYCDARFNRVSGLMTVDMGLEADKAEQAEKTVLKELSALQSGDFKDSDLEDVKNYLYQSFVSTADSLGEIDPWYMGQLYQNHSQSPQQAAEDILQVTPEQVTAALRRFEYRMCYLLAPKGEE